MKEQGSMALFSLFGQTPPLFKNEKNSGKNLSFSVSLLALYVIYCQVGRQVVGIGKVSLDVRYTTILFAADRPINETYSYSYTHYRITFLHPYYVYAHFFFSAHLRCQEISNICTYRNVVLIFNEPKRKLKETILNKVPQDTSSVWKTGKES